MVFLGQIPLVGRSVEASHYAPNHDDLCAKFKNVYGSKSLINIAWSRFLHAQEAMTLYGAINYGSALRIMAWLQ